MLLLDFGSGLVICRRDVARAKLESLAVNYVLFSFLAQNDVLSLAELDNGGNFVIVGHCLLLLS